MDFAQMPYAVRTDASLSGIKCYLCCRLQYMHIDFVFSPFVSVALRIYFSLPFIVIPHPCLSPQAKNQLL